MTFQDWVFVFFLSILGVNLSLIVYLWVNILRRK
jgi:hypothetical protein